mgnify:FL=1
MLKYKDLKTYITSSGTLFVTGLLVGAFVILGVRYVRYQPPKDIHYHANFAVYVNGQREPFRNPLIYEEVEMCSQSSIKTPTTRAHMHDKVSDVIHVEDVAVTWGQFFQNIDANIGSNFVSITSKL